jgi:hypothetical protein
VQAVDPPAAPDPATAIPGEGQVAEGSPVDADPVQIGPEPSAEEGEPGFAKTEPTESDLAEVAAGDGAKVEQPPKAPVAQAAPRKARPRQHSKAADKSDKAASTSSKASPEGALAKAPAAGSKDTEKTSKPGDAAVAKEAAKGADKSATEEKSASASKHADPAPAAEDADADDANAKATDRSARKGSPVKPSRKDVPPSRRKKKTRLAKKSE